MFPEFLRTFSKHNLSSLGRNAILGNQPLTFSDQVRFRGLVLAFALRVAGSALQLLSCKSLSFCNALDGAGDVRNSYVTRFRSKQLDRQNFWH